MAMGPLEQEVHDLMQGPIQGTPGALMYEAGERNWWFRLSEDQRFELFLLTFAGMADAIRRVARAIDEAGGAVPNDSAH